MGKGRDVGMQQIYKFEAKLASGNGEQCLSRDVFRIGQRLDFTRLLSFYYSGIGFYLNNAATVFAPHPHPYPHPHRNPSPSPSPSPNPGPHPSPNPHQVFAMFAFMYLVLWSRTPQLD